MYLENISEVFVVNVERASKKVIEKSAIKKIQRREKTGIVQ